jgi:cell wall-associated NlpC family hydrolase
MTGKRTSVLRLLVAVLLVFPAVVLSTTVSSAHPSKQDVAAAKAKLDQLNRQLDLLVEQYNQAQIRLQQTQAKLDAALHAKQTAEADAQKAMAALNARAVAAYTGMGTQLNVLLGAQSLTDFSDRLAFMGALARNDADLATQASTAGEKAKWAADQYAKATKERQATVNELASRKSDVQSAIASQQATYDSLSTQLRDALAAQAAAQAAAAAAAAGVSASSGDGGGFVPPQNATAAQIAIAAAESVIGTQYVFASADPSVGFDCSGLVMWSYAQAGVSLPHSSDMMYELLPHLSESELVPGDLLFFYSPVSHVAIYLGGSSMIDASHPGPGGEVAIRTIYWQDFVGGGRIG